jgi:hypothetical protein
MPIHFTPETYDKLIAEICNRVTQTSLAKEEVKQIIQHHFNCCTAEIDNAVILAENEQQNIIEEERQLRYGTNRN